MQDDKPSGNGSLIGLPASDGVARSADSARRCASMLGRIGWVPAGWVVAAVLGIALLPAARHTGLVESSTASPSGLRLLLPYPATGPRDIQGAERATRAYKAIAPHLVPGLPTLSELGFGDLVAEGWFAVYASKRMPASAVERTRARLVSARRSPAMRTALLLRGLQPAEETVQQFEHRIAADIRRWTALISTLH